MAGWDVDTDSLHTYADGLRTTARQMREAWEVVSPTVEAGPDNAIGPPDRLASAFYSGYTRRKTKLAEAAVRLPERYAERARAGHESAEIYFTAELYATGGFLG
jgi:hypothetical protein